MCASSHNYRGDISKDLEHLETKEEKRRFLDSIARCDSCICQNGKNSKGGCFLRPQNEIKNLVYEYVRFKPLK